MPNDNERPDSQYGGGDGKKGRGKNGTKGGYPKDEAFPKGDGYPPPGGYPTKAGPVAGQKSAGAVGGN